MFGYYLRQIREGRYESQESLAARVPCAVSTLRRWENGKGKPRPAQLEKLAKALDLPPSLLVEWSVP